jgi:hypothetical protein
MSPGGAEDQEADIIVDSVKDSASVLTKQMSRIQNLMQKRIETIDINTRHLLKHQFDAIGKVKLSLKALEKLISE